MRNFFCYFLLCYSVSFHSTQAQEVPEMEISGEELRVDLDDYFFFFVGKVEFTMDSISNSTRNIAISHSAMVFKSYSVAEAQRSVFVKDPLIGLLDLVTLIIQMEHYYADENGDRLFGPYKGQVVSLIMELKRVVLLVSADLNRNWDPQDAITALTRHAHEYPMLNDYFGRRSVRRVFASLQIQEKVKLKELAVDMASSVGEMTLRLNYYMGLMPRQMRWQMELMMYNAAMDPSWQIDIDSLAESFELNKWIDNYLAQVFDKISLERELIFTGMDDLKSSSLDEVDIRTDSMKVWMEQYSYALTDHVNAKIDSSMYKFEQIAKVQITSTLSQTEEMINRVLIRVFIGLFILVMTYALLRRYIIQKSVK